jgi:hypothetical protein
MNHETLWAREGDVMLDGYPQWSPFASMHEPSWRAMARRRLHGFDFRVESCQGTKRMVINEEAP